MPSSPVPELRSQSSSRCHRGEWGIDRPSQTIALAATSITTPPSVRRSRQPSITSERLAAVTYAALPVRHGKPIEMALVAIEQSRNEGRLPDLLEAMLA